MKVLGAVAEPKSTGELAAALGWDCDEVRQVLSGFVMAELVGRTAQSVAGQFLIFEPDAGRAREIRQSLEASDSRYSGTVVRDKLALQLVLKRSVPHTIIFAADEKPSCELIKKLFETKNPKAAAVKRVALLAADQDPLDVIWQSRIGFQPDATIARPCTAESLFNTLDRLLAGNGGQSPTESPVESSPPVEGENISGVALVTANLASAAADNSADTLYRNETAATGVQS